MEMDLAASELRVLGCLIEKQRTTPDAYPLTLNSLRLACNQSTNRDPVVDYGEAEVRDALHRLERRGLARFAGGAGSRAPKFRHLLSERLPLSDGQQAILCVLMLRGPQTPGELKQRGERLHRFDGLAEVQQTLAGMMESGLVERLPRRPGQKEERYAHLLGEQGGESDAGGEDRHEVADVPALAADASGDSGQGGSATGELERLRARVSRLEREMATLQQRLGLGRTP